MPDEFDDLSDMPKDTITREEWDRRQAKQRLLHTVLPQPKASKAGD